jgi:hypothetical protein
MFRRAFRTSPSHDRRWLKRLGPVGIALALVAAPLALLPLRADAASGDAVLTQDTTINGCNGVLPTPGSENTTKRLDPAFASDFNPGGVVGYIIDFPVDADQVGGDFRITDCVYVDPPGAGSDEPIAKYFIDFVPNTESFQLRFSVDIPEGTALGSQFCNYAKTTQSPSASQASNRKAGPACFTVGGGLRIEKRSGSTTGPLLPGASFSVVCSPTSTQPPTIITGLSNQSVLNGDGTVSATGVAGDGTIAINGPSGTPCAVTETAAPAGYQLDPTTRNLVIPVGASQTINVFVNRQFGSLTISKTANAPGTFTFDVDCSVNSFDRLGENAVVIVNGGTEVIENIPTGTTCEVTERDNPLFSSIVIPDDGTVEITTQGETVAFTNTRITGPLTISKTAIGGTGTFTFDVDCSDNAFDQVVSIEAGASATITGIPTTTSCTVTERENPLFTSSVLPADGTVSIDAGGANVAFVNTAKPNGLTIDKKVNGGDHATLGDALLVHPADALSYTVVITNNAQVPLTITAMSDSLYPALIAACPQAVGSVLAAGASFTCRYGVGAIGDAHNVASVSAVDGLGRTLSGSDGTYVDVLNPAITIVKTANPVSISVSGPVTYSYVVTNTGDTALRDILVTDDIIGAIGQIPELAPGESVTLAKTVDVDASTPPTNIGTAVGTDALGQTVTASDDATITVVLGEVLVLPAELPRTGSPLQAQTRAALMMIQVGLVLTLAGRRRWMVRRAD